MKVQLVTVLLTLLLGAPLVLAEKTRTDNRRGQHRAHTQEKFGITDQQFSKMREIRQNGGSREDAHAIRSDEQRATLRKWREENAARGPGHGGKRTHDADSV
jgi:hypothetical protein